MFEKHTFISDAKFKGVEYILWFIYRQRLHQFWKLSSKWFINIEWTILRWRPVVWPWPCDLKSNRDNRLYKVNQCSKLVNHQAKDHEWTTLRMRVSNLTLTFDHMICKSIGNKSSLRASTEESLATSCTWVKRYWVDNICIKPSGLTLSFYLVKCTSIGVI